MRSPWLLPAQWLGGPASRRPDCACARLASAERPTAREHSVPAPRADMTVVAGVTNATVPSLLKLLEGGYGARVQQPGHVVLAVNGAWTGDARDVGQPWDRCAPCAHLGHTQTLRVPIDAGRHLRHVTRAQLQHSPCGAAPMACPHAMPRRALKAKASAVLSPEAPPSGDSSSRSLQPAPSSSPQHSAGLTLSRWEHLYLCRVLRTSKGGLGLLHRAWPGPFEVYALPLGARSTALW